MSLGARLGILGGTFDPIHVGHVETARAVHRALALDRTLLLPSRVPPHRPVQPAASPFHRFAMAALALNGPHGLDGIEVSDAELISPGPSYTADTLARFRDAGFASSQIFFIIGADAFAEIETWSRYPQVLDLAHFAVVSRPGYDVERIQRCLPSLAGRFAPIASAAATTGPATNIFIIPAMTPDVSSTVIRRRLRRGESVAGMIAEPVERHIRRHRLYTDDQSSSLIPSAADHLHGQN